MIIRHGTRTVKIIIAIVAAILSVAAIFGVLWYHGLFLPRWIEWKNQSLIFEESMDVVVENRKIAVYSDGVKIWEPDKRYYTQSILSADVDKDGKDELLVLCWRIGRYGKRRPFWVKHDKMVWTQHIYIYDVNDGEITPQWMASDIKQLVLDWETLDNRYIVNYSPKGEKSTWEWISWGLERVPDAGETPTYLQEDIKILENIEDERKGADESVDESESNEEKNTSSEGSEKKINKVSVVMVGDMLLHDGVEKSCQDENGEYDYASLFENTKDVISAADIAIVNQEVIIGGRELNVSGYPAFNAPFEFADSLVENGFEPLPSWQDAVRRYLEEAKL